MKASKRYMNSFNVVLEHNYLSDYGMKWLEAWMKTDNFKKWNQYTDNELFEFVEPG